MSRPSQLLQHAKDMRRNPSPTEEKLWLALRAGRIGAKLRRQQVIGPYIVDFACRLPVNLVVEVDGESHAERVDYDTRRTEFLEARAYRVLRFTNREVGENLDGVLEVIATALPLSPPLSPEGERE